MLGKRKLKRKNSWSRQKCFFQVMSSFLSFASVMLQFYFQVPKADSVSKGSRRQNIREKARTGRCSILYINTGKRCLLSKQTLKQWSHFWLAVWHQWVWWHGHAWFQGVSNVFFKEFVNHWLWMKCLCVCLSFLCGFTNSGLIRKQHIQPELMCTASQQPSIA